MKKGHKFSACVCEHIIGDTTGTTGPACGTSYHPLSVKDSVSHTLTVGLLPADKQPQKGVFHSHRLSASKLAVASAKNIMTGSIAGTKLNAVAGQVAVKLTAGAGSCATAADNSVVTDVAVTAAATENDAITFTADFTAAAAGIYRLCYKDGDLAAHKDIGSVAVTGKADLERTWILEPQHSQSLEISGDGLTANDRILLTDCSSACGFAAPSPEVKLPAAACGESLQETFNAFAPQAIKAAAAAPVAEQDDTVYTLIEQRFCAGNNIGQGHASWASHLQDISTVFVCLTILRHYVECR